MGFVRAAIFALIAGLLVASPSRADSSVPIAPPTPASSEHRFDYRPTGDARKVMIAGDFNDWSTDSTPMRRQPDGSFARTLDLPDGIHHYKFVVDGRWISDPDADAEFQQDDGYGGHNSGVLIGIDGRRLPPPPPGKIVADEISHDPADPRQANVVSTQEMRVAVRCQAGNLSDAAVEFSTDNSKWQTNSMYPMNRHMGFDDYDGIIFDNQPLPVSYIFKLTDGGAVGYVADGRLYTAEADARSHPYHNAMQPTFQTPDWSKFAVWYQIFPERFRNGDTANDPPHTERWTSNWWQQQPDEQGGTFYSHVYNRRYGGDVQGLIQALPYLRSLGVNAIYLNPMFEAASLHKYDATDYRHIDEHFGYAGDIAELHGETEDPATWQWSKSDKLFLQFVADAHRQGFKVILDGVFNHVGTPFWAFQDVVKNGRNSKYAGWFDIIDWKPQINKEGERIPFHYRAWDGDNGSLPIFKKDPVLGIVHGPREHILAIAKRWLAPDGDPSRGVDGFRLDACQNVPDPFWIDFRKVVKATKPDAYITGEIWSIAPSYLRGNEFDATMQYPFAEAEESFFVDQDKAISPSQFATRLQTLETVYPFQVSLVQMNLLDSHDTDRWASRFVNPDLNFNSSSRLQDNNPNYNIAKPNALQWTRMEQSLVVQFSYVGAPMIYYGDEAGMWGPSDPSDRMPMVWPGMKFDDPQMTFKQDLFNDYQWLIAVRRKLLALNLGFAHTVLADDADGVYAFSRDLGDGDHVLVVVNRSPTSHEAVLNFGPRDRDVALVNWLDPHETGLSMGNEEDARPEVEPIHSTGGAVVARHGTTTVSLQPWGAMILSVPSAETTQAH